MRTRFEVLDLLLSHYHKCRHSQYGDSRPQVQPQQLLLLHQASTVEIKYNIMATYNVTGCHCIKLLVIYMAIYGKNSSLNVIGLIVIVWLTITTSSEHSSTCILHLCTCTALRVLEQTYYFSRCF